MTQQIIDIGTGPGIGDGDPLRVAFSKINQNFTEIYSGNVTVSGNSSPVTSVAGKAGNVLLTVGDVQGACSQGYALSLVNEAVLVSQAATQLYVDSHPGPVGPKGLDAYEEALQLGFSGTLSDWLASLVGEAGVATVPVPSTSKGQIGDTAGMIAADAIYLYYCYAAYTNGTDDIWKRIANDATTW